MPKKLDIRMLTVCRDSFLEKAKAAMREIQSKVSAQPPASPLELRSILERMLSAQQAVSDYNEDIFSTIDDDEELTDAVTAWTDFTLTIDECKGMVNAYLASLEAKSSTAPTSPATTTDKDSTGTPHLAKLPVLHIAPFSGSPLKWQEFWDSYSSIVHNKDCFSGVEKFQYLKSFLRGDALRLIEAYRMTEANYSTAVKALETRYGDPEVAIQAHLNALYLLPPASSDVNDVQRVTDECEMNIRSLVNLGLPEETFGRIFAPLILSKLPESVRLMLHRANKDTHWKLDNLRTLLQSELNKQQAGPEGNLGRSTQCLQS